MGYFIRILLLMFIFSVSTKAQDCTSVSIPTIVNCVDTLYDPGDFICVGAEDTQTYLSSLISSTVLLNATAAQTTPQHVVILGRLVIDIDYTFAPGSVIIFTRVSPSTILRESFFVAPNRSFTLDGVNIHSIDASCDQLFWVLYLRDSTKLYIDDSYIENLGQVNTHEIVSGSFVGFDILEISVNNNIIVDNLRFIRYLNGNSLSVLNFVGNEFLGYYCNDCVLLYVVDFDDVGQTLNFVSNKVERYSFGIGGDGVRYADIYGNEFKEITTPMDFEESTVYIGNSFFNENYSDAKFKNSNLTVDSCDFYMDFSYGGAISFGGSNSNYCYFTNNNVEGIDLSSGITMYNSTNFTASIRNNYFELNKGHAIIFTNCHGSNVAADTNAIRISGAGFGVVVGSSTNVKVRGNKIQHTSITPGVGTQSGMELVESEGCIIEANEMEGPISIYADSGLTANFGIGSHECLYASIRCNYVEGYDSGISFILDNNPSEILYNTMKENAIGLELNNHFFGSFYAMIGPQDNKVNSWPGSATIAEAKSKDDVLVGVHSPITSQFGTPTIYWPNPISAAGPWFSIIPPTLTSIRCANFEIDTTLRRGELPGSAIVPGVESFSEMTPWHWIVINKYKDLSDLKTYNGGDYDAVLHTLQHLHIFPELRNDPVVNTFYEKYIGRSIGRIMMANVDMWSHFTSPTAGFSSDIYTLQGALTQSRKEGNFEQILSDKNDLDDLINANQKAQEHFGAINGDIIRRLIDDVTAISSESDICSKWKEVLIAKLEIILDGKENLAQAKKEFLERHAVSCYEDYGKSIFLARSLAGIRVSLGSPCTNASDRPQGHEINEQSLVVRLQPNPAKDIVEYRIVNVSVGAEYEYAILGMDGRQYKSGQLTANHGSIDVSSLPASIYIVRIISGDRRFSSSERLIKVD